MSASEHVGESNVKSVDSNRVTRFINAILHSAAAGHGGFGFFDVLLVSGSFEGSLVGDAEGGVIECIVRFELTCLLGVVAGLRIVLHLVVKHRQSQMTADKFVILLQRLGDLGNCLIKVALLPQLFGLLFEIENGLWCHVVGIAYFLGADRNTACAAASRAMGTRNGLQLT